MTDIIKEVEAEIQTDFDKKKRAEVKKNLQARNKLKLERKAFEELYQQGIKKLDERAAKIEEELKQNSEATSEEGLTSYVDPGKYISGALSQSVLVNLDFSQVEDRMLRYYRD